jgi:hypothetical protein
MDKEQAIQEILSDLEHQPLQERRTFRAYLNQPELISLSSTNAELQSAPITGQTNESYFNFTVNLPRPALDAKSLQLLKTVIPQAQCSIPDYALVFPYYRLRTLPIDASTYVFIDTPSFNNLNFIRLLPSYYKKEMLLNNTTSSWGYNQTFNDYEELLTQLTKACLDDRTFTAAYKVSLNDDTNLRYATHYLANDIQFRLEPTTNKFQMRGINYNTVPLETTYPEWDPTTSYASGTIVWYGIGHYISIKPVIGVPPPPSTPTLWEEIFDTNMYTIWKDDWSYKKYNAVWYQHPSEPEGSFYIAIRDSIDADPFEYDAYWVNSSAFFEDFPLFNNYIIAGYNDPNVQTLLDFVSTVSTNNDTIFSSIPGNPPVANQTLSRRMGFTWDGTGMRTTTINDFLSTPVDFGSTIALFYNRTRPFTRYVITETPPLSLFTENDEIGINVYTADGYCNLVYSSIISIYTIIVGTSSVDSQRNANLLAMVEMNCGNLGIAMASGFIDTKLTKIQSDIYSIYIELRDENGQPYYLTNNATSTFLLKLTYD